MTQQSSDNRITVDLLRRYDRPGPRYTSYPTVPVWSETVGQEAYRQALRNASSRVHEPLALYLHIPFCKSRCYYCGCTTCVTKDIEAPGVYLEAVYRELDEVASLLGDRRAISQVHFGGGTPTYIGVDGLGRVIDEVQSHFVPTGDCEMSIEVDPRRADGETVRRLHELSFNRISFGVQDFDPEVQRAIGRIQSENRVQEVLTAARDVGYSGINFDLIYGLPRQTGDSFERTLATTLAMRPDRIALYSFAYLPKLRPNQASIQPEELPDTEVKYSLFSTAINRLTDAGYLQIGMDHFALPEDELAQAQDDGRLHRNFMGYTVQSAGEMLGIGSSSIGYIDDTFVQNESDIVSYQEKVADSGLATYRGLRLSRDDLVRQYVVSQLMCNFSLRFDKLQSRFSVRYGDYFAEEDRQLEPLIADGLLTRDASGLAVTRIGRTLVRNIAMTFDAYLKQPSKRGTFSRTI